MIRSTNSDNSGAARAKRIRWQATAGGPKVRTNVGSMALGGILWNQGVYPQEGTIGRVGPEPEPEPGPGPGPGPVPDAPTIIDATAGNSQATIRFTPPINDGGSTIISYTVTSSPDGITATGSASPITVTGLTNSTEYTFTVVATNANGNSEPSGASNSIIPSTFFTRRIFTSDTEEWTAPPGVTSVNYLVVGGGGGGGGSYDGGAGGGGGGGLVLTGTTAVTPNQLYTIVVGAGGVGGVGQTTVGDGLATAGGTSSFDTINASGGGAGGGSLVDRSGVGGSQGDAGTLTSPTGGKGGRNPQNTFGGGGGGGMGTDGATAISAANATGGSGIVSNMTGSNVTYGAGGRGGRVLVNANGGSAGANTGNGGNGAGSAYSDGSTGGNGGSGLVVLTYYLGSEPPQPPTITDATAGNSQATISFTAPINDGGSTILSYTVTSSPDGITATGSASPITVTGLTNGIEYTFTVVATNALGDSDPSEPSDPITPSNLAAPVIQNAIADNGGVYIYFSQPSGTATNYGYILDGNEPHTIFSPATTSSPLYITDLQNNEEVGIQIVAIGSPSTQVSGLSNLITVTPTDIENETGPTLYYDANDYTSGSITNSAPGGVSLSGTLTSVSRVAGPTTGYVFDFPGSGYISFGTYNFGTVMTISAWIKSRSKFSTNTLISNCTVGGSADGFAIGWTFWNTNDLDCYMESGNGDDGGKNFSVPNMVTNGVWQHYGCVFDQANRQVIFFINGSPVKIVNITLTYTVGMNNTIFNIGAYADNSYGMNAQLGYIKVYNYLFNATDMLAEYQNNKARFGL